MTQGEYLYILICARIEEVKFIYNVLTTEMRLFLQIRKSTRKKVNEFYQQVRPVMTSVYERSISSPAAVGQNAQLVQVKYP